MVEVGTGTNGSRFLKTNYPIEEGLVLGTNKLPSKAHLIPETDLTDLKDREGL
jgi:hypothetical protein